MPNRYLQILNSGLDHPKVDMPDPSLLQIDNIAYSEGMIGDIQIRIHIYKVPSRNVISYAMVDGGAHITSQHT